MIVRLSVGPAGAERFVVLESRDEADCAELPTILALSPGPLTRISATDAAEALPAQGPLHESGLLDGDRLLTGPPPAQRTAFTRPDPSPTPVLSGWQLSVLEGPERGRTVELAPGNVSVGRSSDNDVQLSDPEISRMHLLLEVTKRGVHLTDRGSVNGTSIDGHKITGSTKLEPGARVGIGTSVFSLTRAGALPTAEHRDADAEAAIEPDGNGGLLLNRVLSLRSAYEPVTVIFPSPPRARDKRSVQWVPALLPIPLALGIAYFANNWMFLGFAFLSPVSLLASVFTNRRADNKANKRAVAEYAADSAAAEGRVDTAVAAETGWRRTSGPSGDEVARIALTRTDRLWERSPRDVDFLQVRLGAGNEPASVTVAHGTVSAAPESVPAPVQPQLVDVPLCVNLAQAGVLGIAGPRADRMALARSILIQLAGLHAADEVRLAFAASHASEAEWGLFRWLPHTWTADERRLDVAQGSKDVSALVERLLRVVEDRTESRWGSDGGRGATHVVFMDGIAALRQREAVARLLVSGPAAGVYAVVLDDQVRQLPEECLVRTAVTGTSVWVENVTDRRERTGRVDALDSDSAAKAARALAPIRRVGGQDAVGSELPTQVTLFEMLAERPTITSVTERWRTGVPTTTVPLGIGPSGVVGIDLVRSGPHALVGGTTESGKSELVQTWIASLALHNRPDQLAFLFIEYKGLSAFKTVQGLPHCVGTITNLSPDLMVRALASLDAEKTRRQRLFERAGAVDFAEYQQARVNRPDLGLEPMPRLIIALDEFAELKQELPEFVTDLVSMFRTGRSIGVHLLLATQQIQHVSNDIAGNASLRVGLRTQSADDSMAVMNHRAASTLPMAVKGRAYVRRGSEDPELVQTAWSRAPVDTTERGSLVAHPWPWRSDEQRMQTTFGAPSVTVTELEDLVQVLSDTADQMAMPRPRRPFTEALETDIALERVMALQPVEELADLVRLGGPAIGEADEISRQLHTAYAIPLLRNHVSVIGSAKSGRTTTVRTTVSSWAQCVPPSMLNVHVIDSGRGLTALTTFPHTGTVTSPETAQAGRLLSMLAAEVNRRLAVLEQHSMGDVVEMWDRPELGDPLPWILLAIDRFEDLATVIGDTGTGRGSSLAAFERVLTHGLAAGISVLAAGDETLSRTRWQQRFGVRLALRNTGGLDPVYVGLPARTPLSTLVDGRCYESTQAMLVQIAHEGVSPTAGDQNDALRRLGRELAADRWANMLGSPPVRLRELPDEVKFASLPSSGTKHGVVIGVGGDAAAPVELRRQDLPVLVVGTEARDRAAVLGRVADQWATGGLDVVVAGPRAALLTANPPVGIPVVTAEGQVDWVNILADPDAAVVVDDLHANALPDDLVTALEATVPRCRFLGGCTALTMVPAPLKAVVAAGSLLYVTPSDPRAVEYFGVSVDPTLCAPSPRGRGVLVRGRDQVAVQLALDT